MAFVWLAAGTGQKDYWIDRPADELEVVWNRSAGITLTTVLTTVCKIAEGMLSLGIDNSAVIKSRANDSAVGAFSHG